MFYVPWLCFVFYLPDYMMKLMQGASLFSLTLVTLNRAAMLFLPTKVDKVQNSGGCRLFVVMMNKRC